MRTKQTVISIVVLTVLLSLLLVSPVAGTEVSTRTIKVFKLYDINGNGEKDAEDGPKEGWLMSVYAHDGTEWVFIGQGSTDANGYVTFSITTQSTGDNYMVVEEARECWWPTFPDVEEGYGGYYTVRNVPDGEQRTQWFKNTYECGGEGCTLTPGYWKTHSIYGPAPYDNTWAQIGEDTAFFSSGQSYYEVLWTEPEGGNAYYILAHAYIAAGLNQLNGADFAAAQAAFEQATILFETYTPDEVAAMKKTDKAMRAHFISLAETLDNYNNGLIGPGHCAE